MRFLDANVFIRYLALDDARKAEASRKLFVRIGGGEEEVMCSESIIAEVFFVMTSPRLYAQPRNEVVARVRPLVTARGLRFPAKQIIVRALDFYEAYRHLDFEDALNLAHMEAEGIAEVYSYDHDFDGIDGVTRIEP